MKICNFLSKSDSLNTPRMGVIHGDLILDVNLIWRAFYTEQGRFNAQERANYIAPNSLFKILNLKDRPLDFFKETLDIYLGLSDPEKFNSHFTLARRSEKSQLLRPLDKIATYRDFYIHEKHVKKGFEKRNEPVPPAWYEIPAYYKGATEGIIGPEETILWPQYTDKLDFELELAAVMGRECMNIRPEDIKSHIFGYTILNDISARDIQKKEMSIRLGPSKGKDFCSVIGPVIVTADEFNYESPDLLMTASINGEKWSEGRSGDGHYSFQEMVAFAAMDEWVVPGDLIGSGTVGTGCGLELDKWPKQGDSIDLYVENIGNLVNKIGHKGVHYGKL